MISASGIELYFEEHGSGLPLLLIQGLSYATPMWSWQIQDLKRDFRVIVFDNRGSGQSSKPDIPYTLPLFAKDSVSLMSALGIAQAAVLGISMGGLIAQEIAVAFPERVSHLILCCAPYGGGAGSQPDPETVSYLLQYQEQATDDVCRLEIAYGTAPGFSERHPDRVEKLVEFKKKSRPPRFAYLRQLMSAVGYENESRLRKINFPTLILAGKKDRIISPSIAEQLHELIPGSQIHFFADAGHHPHIEEPEEFNACVRNFLKGIKSGNEV